jgi:uncharacterized protein (TIGR00255 family)
MTGYGSAAGNYENIALTIEIRGVNSRYLELSVRQPRTFNFAEDAIKQRVQAAVTRGKIDVNVTVDSSKSSDVEVTVNPNIAAAYIDALRTISNEYAIPNDFGTTALARIPDVFTVAKKEVDKEAFSRAIAEIAGSAVESYNAMRLKEGDKLCGDILRKLSELETYARIVKRRSPESVAEYRAKLTAKMRELLADTAIDETRIVQEAALFADKVAVDEELTRLESHIAQAREMLVSSEPIGRKLDFLIQELMREVNTTGSKCSDLSITKTVLEMKAVIEKIREQCQNLE